MSKSAVRTPALVLLLALLSGPVDRVFASDSGPTSTPSTTTTATPSPTTSGITGTDPEPIDPGTVTLILSLLGLP
jgi:hypothetical protein